MLIPPTAISRFSETTIPTAYGDLRVVVYRETESGKEHVATVCGDPAGRDGVLTRVHSECFTGEVLHSLKCECREQLDFALNAVSEAGVGVVVYLRQEGRGIGLGNKIQAYALQEQGLDTVDANTNLGFGADDRRYDVAVEILRDLGVTSVALMTNNPLKIEALRQAGIVVDRRTLEVDANPHSLGYLLAKRDRMGHQLEGLPASETAIRPPDDSA